VLIPGFDASYLTEGRLRKSIMTALTLNLDAIVQLTDNAFYTLCQANPEIQFERTAKGELIVMSPTGGETGRRNLDLLIQLGIWSKQNETRRSL